jgi:superfamily II DNA/RNA helicase
MSRKQSGGFKAPKNYEPRRGKSTRKPSRSYDRADAHAAPSGSGRNRSRRSTPSARSDRPWGERHRHDNKRRHEDFRSAPTKSAKTGARAQSPWGGGARVHRFSDKPSEKRFGREADSASAARFVAEEKHYDKLEAEVASADTGSELTFADLGLGRRITDALAEQGAEHPFAIQTVAIPDILAGKDVLGRASTGSGKTIAFGAALVERLLQLKAEGLFANDPKPEPRRRGNRDEGRQNRDRRKPARASGRKPKALILAPTRELALQIDRTVQPLARMVGLFTTQLVGGAPIARQQHALERGIDIAIGTPGRIEDLVKRGNLDLSEVTIAVLDEADHMSELGFAEPVQRILRQVKSDAQTLMFSATLDGEVAAIADEFMSEPAVHEIAGVRSGEIEHHVLVVLREHKDDVLVQLAQPRTIMFTRTRAYAEQVADLLRDQGVSAVDLHGDLNQMRREKNLKRFTENKADVLVATDVAARGLHVDDIALVVQADPPDNHKAYLHRSGRTGRAGRSGVVMTVIPRTRQKKTRRMLDEAGIKPQSVVNFSPGDTLPTK